MKTDVDTCLKDIADFYVRNRREMTEPELETILLKHCESEREMQKFAHFLSTEPGQHRFKTILIERKAESGGSSNPTVHTVSGFEIPTTRVSSLGFMELELPVARAVETLWNENPWSSGFHEALNKRWTIVFRGKISGRAVKAARAAGLEVSYRELLEGSGQFLTDVSLPSVGVTEIEKATKAFNRFAELYEGSPEEDTIFFNVPEAREQLIREGFVYTLRPKMRRTGWDVAYYGSYYKKEKIGDVWVSFIKEIQDMEELKPYFYASGFETLEAWWKVAKGSRFLFRVSFKRWERKEAGETTEAAIIHEATSKNPDPAELMPVEVPSAFPEGAASRFNPQEKAQIERFINEVPDKNDTMAINYWLDWGDRKVYLEGWIDKCLAGTGFPPMEGGEWDEKIEYMVRDTHRTLREKEKERGLTLIEGGFREFEAGDKAWLYGVTWGVYEKPS